MAADDLNSSATHSPIYKKQNTEQLTKLSQSIVLTAGSYLRPDIHTHTHGVY